MEAIENIGEAQRLASQIVYFREEMERKKEAGEPYTDSYEKLASATVRLDQLLSGL